jgi:hypothetical protein
MKKKALRRVLVLAVMLSLVLTMMPVQAAVSTSTETTAAKTTVKNGWKKESVGYCYYVNGKKLTSQWKTISGKKYYFGSNGARKTGWYTIKNKSYYFDSKGVYVKSKSIDQKLVTAMDSFLKKQKITDNTSATTALKKIFTALQNTSNYGYARAPLGFNTPSGWEYDFAKEMLTSKKGSCYHYAAAFAFLAKRATGYPVRICWGTSNAFNASKWQNHAWVEIKIGSTWYTYDANAAAYSTLRSGKWYQQKRSSMEGKVYKTVKTVNVEL